MQQPPTRPPIRHPTARTRASAFSVCSASADCWSERWCSGRCLVGSPIVALGTDPALTLTGVAVGIVGGVAAAGCGFGGFSLEYPCPRCTSRDVSVRMGATAQNASLSDSRPLTTEPRR